MSGDVYRRVALAEAARLVAMLDRNPHSRTRGSFSRSHWAWKFTDFPFPRLQEGAYALSRLHDLDVPGNPWFGSPAVQLWVEWSLDYWVSLQHRNGAFDEAYPFEQCLAATAFTGFYIGSTLDVWGERLDRDVRERVDRALLDANRWLCHNDETHGLLSNHLAVAAASLQLGAKRFARPEFAARARMFIDRILAHQSAEGWMSEYGGADIGYGGHALFYLARYWQMTGAADVRDALIRFCDFLSYFVHPDGTIGGEYGSRNTEFYYPAGFEMLSPISPAAAAIASRLRRALAEGTVCGVPAMDEFNLMPMLNNAWFAADAATSDAPSSLPFAQPPFRKYFAEAGLWVVNESSYYAVVGASKGGTVSLFDKRAARLSARHSGLIATTGAGRFASQDHVLSPSARIEGDTLHLADVAWKSVETTTFSPLLFLAFRMFNLTFGRIASISRWLKQTLVRRLISRKQRPSVTHQRDITATADGVTIVDRLTTPWPSGTLSAGEQFTAVHMGSSLYADARTAGGGAPLVSVPLARRLTLRGTLTLSTTTWTLDTD